MLFQLKFQSNPGTPRPLPIKKRRPDLKITLKKLANEPQGARFRALFCKLGRPNVNGAMNQIEIHKIFLERKIFFCKKENEKFSRFSLFCDKFGDVKKRKETEEEAAKLEVDFSWGM